MDKNILIKARYVDQRREMPATEAPAFYSQRRSDGTVRTIEVKGTERQLLEMLAKGPIYAASRINLSAYIDRLRYRRGVGITTHRYPSEAGGSFGVYALTAPVVFMGLVPRKQAALPPMPPSLASVCQAAFGLAPSRTGHLVHAAH